MALILAAEAQPAEDPAASLGLVGSAEEDTAAAKMQAVQRGRAARRGVEEKEAEQLAEPELKRARKKFEQMDKDGNGTLDAAEMRELALWVFSSFHPGGDALPADRQQKEAEKLTKRLDADGDGKLSFEEFAAWFKKTCLGIAKYRKGLAQKKRAEAVAQKEKEQKQRDQKAQQAAAAKLDTLPLGSTPAGKMVVLELEGGNDKQKKGDVRQPPAHLCLSDVAADLLLCAQGKGHRRDTFPICNAVVALGWSCFPVLYSDARHDVATDACAQADGA